MSPRLETRDSERLPRKSGLSSLTAQAMPAASGSVMASVSWLTMRWPFSRRSTRWASTPNGAMPSVFAGIHQRLPDVQGIAGRDVDLVGELAGEANAHHAARDPATSNWRTAI